MAITLTETAASRVRNFLEQRGGGEGMRFGVKSSGCSGFAYVVDFADTIEAGDQVYETHGVKVIVDAKSLPYVSGTEIDFRREGINEVFVYDNPNVKSECGCGESFGIE
ncbi:MAG: iron-sulfur cluster assembly accessory protein [Pseudomonadota bacterium]